MEEIKLTQRCGDIHLVQFLSSSPIGSFYSLQTQEDQEREQQPLIASSSSSPRLSTVRSDPRHRYHPSDHPRNSAHVIRRSYHSQDESSCLDIIMEKIKDSKVARFVDSFAVESEPGLTNTQLMLTNHDLKSVEPERRQWGAWNFAGLWIGTSSKMTCIAHDWSSIGSHTNTQNSRLLQHQHMDDIFFHDHQFRSILVAILALCLDRLLHLRSLRLPNRPDRSEISYWLLGRHEVLLRYLGLPVARFQQSRNGMCMVRSSGLDWRHLREVDDTVHLDFLRRPSEYLACKLWNEHKGFCCFLTVLGGQSSSYLGSGSSSSSPVHC